MMDLNKSLICGVDIGGTLAKSILFIPDGVDVLADYQYLKTSRYQSIKSKLLEVAWVEDDLSLKVPGGTLLFLKYLSSKAELAGQQIRKLQLIPEGSAVHATGGGAFKFEPHVKDLLKIDMIRHDEMDSLIRGLRLMLRMPNECFELDNILFQGDRGSDRERLKTRPILFDSRENFLVVNIGSGVSFLHCTADSYQRVGGSSLGGSTFLGLCAMLTGVDHFDKAIDLAALGDSAKVDLLVKDIYGNETKDLYGLKGSTLASSFGKMISRRFRKGASKSDLVLSTLVMISMNVAALAHLHAKLHGAKSVVFTGNFLARSEKTFRGLRSYSELHLHKRNSVAMRTLAYAVSFWSAGERTAVFLKHDGYLGALGALSNDVHFSSGRILSAASPNPSKL